MKLRQCKHPTANGSLFKIFQCSLLNRYESRLAIKPHRIIRNNLHVFMHDACTTIETRIEEHESIHGDHRDACRFEIVQVERIDLPFKFFSYYDYMTFTNREFIEYQSVGLCHVVDQLSRFKWFYKWILACLLSLFSYQWAKAFWP